MTWLLQDFISLAHQTGPGKYMLGRRGKGIKGFQKITDCVVDETIEPTAVFAAETISVRRTLKPADMSDAELMELLGSMSRTSMTSPEEMTTFQKDLEAIHRELARRNTGTSVAKSSESSPSPAIASAGFAVGNKSAAAMGLMGGLVIGDKWNDDRTAKTPETSAAENVETPFYTPTKTPSGSGYQIADKQCGMDWRQW